MTVENLEQKIYGCWLGKAIGGTLGGPLEGYAGPMDYDFYPVASDEPMPNDDLDLQLVWVYHLLNERSTEVTPEVLSEAWIRYIRFPMDEYGVCLRNQSYGLKGAELGAFDNWFHDCMGAAIRSELWACLAAGDPARAAGFAWADAVCDHCGDGVWAEIFWAAAQAAAFVGGSASELIEAGLKSVPESSQTWAAVDLACRRWSDTGDWKRVRQEVLQRFDDGNFTRSPMNVAFTVLGLLAGEGDFGRSICIAVNCGEDTDCTGATLGALLGIMDPSSIPEKWKAPIGDRIAISPEIASIEAPATVGELTDMTLRLRRQLEGFAPAVGEVVAAEAPSCESSPVGINCLVGFSESLAAADSYASALERCTDERVLGGHWERIMEFPKGVRFSKYTLRLEAAGAVLVQAYSQLPTRVWVDGLALDIEVVPDAHAERSPAPSFHRGGRGQYVTPALEAGRHEMLVAVLNESSVGEAVDLVVGIGDVDTKMWLPDALATRSSLVSQ